MLLDGMNGHLVTANCTRIKDVLYFLFDFATEMDDGLREQRIDMVFGNVCRVLHTQRQFFVFTACAMQLLMRVIRTHKSVERWFRTVGAATGRRVACARARTPTRAARPCRRTRRRGRGCWTG